MTAGHRHAPARATAALLLALASAACDSGPVSIDVEDPLPGSFAGFGVAEGSAGSLSVSCGFAVQIEDVTATENGWAGQAMGEVERQVLENGVPVFRFTALVSGEATLSEIGSAVGFRFVGDQAGSIHGFWVELNQLEGTETSSNSYAGNWICGSLTVEEDPGLQATGTWTLGPTAD